MQLTKLNLPKFDPKLTMRGIEQLIFDVVRRKYIVLTAEEWVRQHFLNYLIKHKAYPIGLIRVEQQVLVSSIPQRADIVVYSRKGQPIMVVECKAPGVELSNSTFAQAARYNISLGANYLVITNGMDHFCCKVNLESNSYLFLNEIPVFDDLQSA